MRRFVCRTSAVAVLLLLPLAAARCAGLSPSPLAGSSQEKWVRALTLAGVDASTTVNPIAFTPEMRAAALELARGTSTRERLRWLQDGIYDPGRFPFRYMSRGTFTASEAFRERKGNCLSFTCLFIAMARSIGIEVRAAIPEFVERSELEGDLVVVNTHVVAAFPFGDAVEVYDFDRTRTRRVIGARFIDDLHLAALYENNKGVEDLREARLSGAVSHFETATRLSPGLVPAWGNLGVGRRRAGDVPGAFAAYRAGLAIEPRDSRILGNLATLYRTLGNERAARSALALAGLGTASPYFLVVRGDLERAEGRTSSALRLYRKAHHRAPGIAEPLIAIAELELQRGRVDEARAAAREALALDPANELARAILDRAGG